MRSTDVDRCIQSAMVNMQSFFNSSTTYVPIHTVPQSIDGLLKPAKICKKYLKIKEELVKTPRMEELNKEHEEDLR